MKKILLSGLFVVAASAHAIVYTFPGARSTQQEVEVGQIKNGSKFGTQVNFHLKTMVTKEINLVAPMKNFQKMKFETLSTTTFPGTPSLPFYSVLVADHPENIELQYILGKKILLDNIYPAPSPVLPLRNQAYSEDYSSINWPAYDASISKLYTMEYIGDYRGTPLTKITFFPMQYGNTKKYESPKLLQVFPEISFNVYSKKQSFLANFTDSDTLLNEAQLNKRYLIVTPSKFVNALNTFVNWKNTQGYDVDVVTLEEAGATPDKVKAFLQARFDNLDTRYTYALLVGNESVFPCFYRSTSSSSRTPTDLPYFTMGGATDMIADVFYGRFVVSTEKDILNQTQKIMQYEKGEFSDMSGFSHGIGIASNEGSAPSDVEYIKSIAKPFEDNIGTLFAYLLQGSNTATVKMISENINKGTMWVNYVGHGTGYAWASTNDNFGTSAIKNLSNADKVKPVIIDVACMNGKFANGYFGERWMNEVNTNGQPIGAVMYFGGSVNISWHPPAVMARAIAQKIIEKKIQTTGEAVFAGQMELSATWSKLKEVQDNMTWYHLFGDPGMKLRLQ